MSTTMQNFRVAGRSIGDILRDVNTILKEKGVEEEEYFFHDATQYGPTESRMWPNLNVHNLRWVSCFPVKGSNEGLYVHIELIFDSSSPSRIPGDGPRRHIGTAKCWTWGCATQMAMIAAEIFEGPDAHHRRDEVWGPIKETA